MLTLETLLREILSINVPVHQGLTHKWEWKSLKKIATLPHSLPTWASPQAMDSTSCPCSHTPLSMLTPMLALRGKCSLWELEMGCPKRMLISETFQLPTGRQKTASPSSAGQQARRKVYQTEHTWSPCPRKTPLQAYKCTFPKCSGGLHAAWTNLMTQHGAPGGAALFPPTSCPFLPRIPKADSEEAWSPNPVSKGRYWHSTSLII